jgi:hypothetical protein
MSQFSYGELLAIYDGLEKLPKSTVISYKTGVIKFEPVKVSDLMEKVKAEGELFELVNDVMNRV